MDPRAGLYGRGKCLPQLDSIPDRPVRRLVAIPTEISRPHSLKIAKESSRNMSAFLLFLSSAINWLYYCLTFVSRTEVVQDCVMLKGQSAY